VEQQPSSPAETEPGAVEAVSHPQLVVLDVQPLAGLRDVVRQEHLLELADSIAPVDELGIAA